jgi:hypothetical protein
MGTSPHLQGLGNVTRQLYDESDVAIYLRTLADSWSVFLARKGRRSAGGGWVWCGDGVRRILAVDEVEEDEEHVCLPHVPCVR